MQIKDNTPSSNSQDRFGEIFLERLDLCLSKGTLHHLAEVRNFVVSDSIALYLYELFTIAHVPYPAMDEIELMLREEADELFLKTCYGLLSIEELAFRRGITRKRAV